MKCKSMGVEISPYTPSSHSKKVYSGDLWECPECGKSVISGFGQPFIVKGDTPDIIYVK